MTHPPVLGVAELEKSGLEPRKDHLKGENVDFRPQNGLSRAFPRLTADIGKNGQNGRKNKCLKLTKTEPGSLGDYFHLVPRS